MGQVGGTKAWHSRKWFRQAQQYPHSVQVIPSGAFPSLQMWKHRVSNEGTDDKDEEDESSYGILSTCCEHSILPLLLITTQGGRCYYPQSPVRGIICRWSYTDKWQNGDSNPSAVDSKPSLWAIDLWGAILDLLFFRLQSSSSKHRHPWVPWGL